MAALKKASLHPRVAAALPLQSCPSCLPAPGHHVGALGSLAAHSSLFSLAQGKEPWCQIPKEPPIPALGGQPAIPPQKWPSARELLQAAGKIRPHLFLSYGEQDYSDDRPPPAGQGGAYQEGQGILRAAQSGKQGPLSLLSPTLVQFLGQDHA